MNPIKVLIVEDHVIARKASKLLLTQLGCVVEQSDNASNTLETLKKNRYDIVFIDIGLPDMDGLTLAKKIRLEKLINKKTHIIILTAHENREYRNQSQLMNAGFIVKPLTFEKSEELLKMFKTAS
jgi:CheY-like chemotaxis protein